MTLGLAFAILMLIWIAFGWWGRAPGAGIKAFGGDLILFLLLLLLGWQVFGPLIHR